jgi:very-short-patch-repair endonuclease
VPTQRNARRLRRTLSAPEVRLWVRLRIRGPDRPIFRRQHPLGPYVLDFYCPAAKLCIEVDGWGHNMGNQPDRDERRDTWLAALGIETLRIPAVDVLRDVEAVADVVVNTAIARCAEAAPSTTSWSPSPVNGGGDG